MEPKCPIEMPPAVGYLTRSAGVYHLSLFTKFCEVHSEVYNDNLSSEYDFIYSIRIYYIIYILNWKDIYAMVSWSLFFI